MERGVRRNAVRIRSEPVQHVCSMFKQPAKDRMTSINLPLDSVFQSAEVRADHVLDHLYCTFGSAIAWALANSTELRNKLYQLFVTDRLTVSADLGQCSFNNTSYGRLLILFIHQLANSGVPKEVGKAIDDRVVGSFHVADRREVGVVRVQLTNKSCEKRFLRLAGEAVIGTENVDGSSGLRFGREVA